MKNAMPQVFLCEIGQQGWPPTSSVVCGSETDKSHRSGCRLLRLSPAVRVAYSGCCCLAIGNHYQLRLESKISPTETGASSRLNATMERCSAFSKTPKFCFSRPSTLRPKASVTVTGTRVMSVLTRMDLADSLPGRGLRNVDCRVATVAPSRGLPL